MNDTMRYGFIAYFFLLLALQSSAQTPYDRILDNFQYLEDSVPYNKVYIHFDKPYYFSGDTIYFNGFVTEPSSNQLIERNTVCFVSFLNASGRKLDSLNLRVEKGRFSGYIKLDHLIQSGDYTMTAHVESMRNYSADFFYHNSIRIINDCTETEMADPVNLQLFCEGGKFTLNKKNKLLLNLKSNRRMKEGREFYLLENLDTVYTGLTDRSGIAQFDLTPYPNNKYAISVKESRIELPEASHADVQIGFSIQDQKIRFNRVQNETTQASLPLYIFIHQSSRLLFNQKIDLKDSMNVSIPQSVLRGVDGITNLVVLDSRYRIVYERAFVANLPISSNHVLNTDKATYGNREKVTYDIVTTNNNVRRDEMSYSISVLHEQLYNDILKSGYSDIRSYLNYNSECLSDLLISDSLNINEINKLLISSTGTRIDWNSIPFEPYNERKIKSNRSNLSASGRLLVNQSSDESPESIRINFYSAEYDALFEGFTTSSNNELDLNLFFDFEGYTQAFYQLHESSNITNQDIQIELAAEVQEVRSGQASTSLVDTSFHLSPNTRPLCTDFMEDYLGRKSVNKFISESFGFYEAPEQYTEDSNETNNSFFGNYSFESDLKIKLDEFIAFSDMRQLTKEILHNLQIRTRKGKEIIRVYNRDIMHTLYGGPLFILDGIPTFDKDDYLDLNPANLESIEVISSFKNINRFGEFGKNGIVIVKSKKGEEFKQKKNNIISFQGYQAPANRSFPDYSQIDSGSPDFRSLIYWDQIDTSHEETRGFYLSDDIASLRISVVGITSDGIPFQSFQIIQSTPVAK